MTNTSDDEWASFLPEEEEEEDVQADESQNRTFLIGAIILGALFVMGICLIVIYLLVLRPRQQPQVSANELTNQVQMTYAAETLTAASVAPPSPTEPGVIIVETTVAPSPTEQIAEVISTPTFAVTAEESLAGATQVAEITATPTALIPEETAGTPSSIIIIEVTPLPVTPADALAGESTQIVGGEESAIVGGVTPTDRGGPVVTQAVLPATGFASGINIAGIGLLGIALAGIAFVVRRMRLR